MAQATPNLTAPLERAPYVRPTMSASRLKALGGEKGATGCERKLAGQYLFGLKQASTEALERGTALHSAAEVLQATGEIHDPEREVGRILRSGAHLIMQCGDLLVEWEHAGTLPDGSPYVAFLDGHTEWPDPLTGTVIVQDLKTTGNAAYALVPGNGEYGLLRDIQVMFYNWILLCNVHWFCPPLPDGHYGPKHWRVWDPKERNARSARDRWLYFLTRGVPRAWEVTDFCLPATAAAFMRDTIMPLVQKINWIHEWHYANPGATLDQFDRNFNACQRKQKWCGVGENNACDFEALGTPISDLIKLKVRPKMTPQERLAALKKNVAAGVATGVPAAPATPAAELTSPPKAETATTAQPSAAVGAATTAAPSPQPATEPTPLVPVVVAAETSTTAPASAEPAPKARRGRPPRAPAAPPGAGVNPPEVVEALAAVNAAAPETVAPTAPPVVEGEANEDKLLALVARLQVAGINPSVVINVQVKR